MSDLLDNEGQDRHDSRSYMYPIEQETGRPNIMRPITCDADIPRASEAGHTFVNEMTNEVITQNVEKLAAPNYDGSDFSSDTDDPMDQLYAPMKNSALPGFPPRPTTSPRSPLRPVDRFRTVVPACLPASAAPSRSTLRVINGWSPAGDERDEGHRNGRGTHS